MKIKNTIWIIIGILIGLLTGYLRSFNPMSFWTLSDLAGRYGFWIFTVSLIAYFSKNKKESFINSFLYMFFMCVSYYVFLYINKGTLYLKQFILWGLFSIVAAIYSILIRKTRNEQNKFDFVVCSIPIILLGIEFMNLLQIFINYHTNFMQLIIDLIGTVTLIILFMKNKDNTFKNKLLICSVTTVLIVCLSFLILWSI